MPKCAYRFGAPDAMMMVSTATPVLHDARTRCLTPCDGQKPEESRGHFRPHGMQTRDKPVRKIISKLLGEYQMSIMSISLILI